MPGTLASSKILSLFLLTALFALGGAACKQDEGERCEVNEDCAEGVCVGAAQSMPGAGGICRAGGAGPIDAGAPVSDGGETATPVDAIAGADAAPEAAAETAPAIDATAETADTAAPDAPDVPASNAPGDLPSGDLAGQDGNG